jgi:ATP-dependent Clp protease adaptor protein ClpS
MMVAVGDTKTSPAAQSLTAEKLEGLWHVVVLNDPVNLMSYVVMVFRKVFGFDEPKARKHKL